MYRKEIIFTRYMRSSMTDPMFWTQNPVVLLQHPVSVIPYGGSVDENYNALTRLFVYSTIAYFAWKRDLKRGLYSIVVGLLVIATLRGAACGGSGDARVTSTGGILKSAPGATSQQLEPILSEFDAAGTNTPGGVQSAPAAGGDDVPDPFAGGDQPATAANVERAMGFQFQAGLGGEAAPGASIADQFGVPENVVGQALVKESGRKISDPTLTPVVDQTVRFDASGPRSSINTNFTNTPFPTQPGRRSGTNPAVRK